MLQRMKLLDDERNAIDLSTTPLHLGLGSRARPIDGFAFDPAVLQAYGDAVAEDGIEGRMVVLIDEEGPGDHWERHPAGDEVVVCVSGTVTVVRDVGGPAEQVVLRPGEATVNPAGVWHAVDVDGAARILTITPGVGTEHRPR
ncbi:Cupin domain-containing protein [Pseudonocardia ammonioxydans]|uniref:Cupin domain-containing protein n=2 Tax=Pseudonocardia ammonioxydans TaxID=260086 RepID=A0A1I5FDD1_PSUAM|nr:Cupin domain-containing protein [Pseudonocardia ammonioxydans]